MIFYMHTHLLNWNQTTATISSLPVTIYTFFIKMYNLLTKHWFLLVFLLLLFIKIKICTVYNLHSFHTNFYNSYLYISRKIYQIIFYTCVHHSENRWFMHSLRINNIMSELFCYCYIFARIRINFFIRLCVQF